MGKKNKGKRNNKSLSESIFMKKTTKKKLNPFEMKISREKHDILGRKKHKQVGLPGVSQQTKIHKRKNTLLKEYKRRNKRNVFVDKRINNEERPFIYKPFETMKDKTDMYNLNEEEEELTHHGHTVSEIETFDNFNISDEDDDEDKKLKADFVEKAHFGGLLIEKKKDEEIKTRKELIQEIIAESKKKKYERQSEREETLEMTEKLDAEWKAVQHLVSKANRKNNEEEQTKVNVYDLTLHELKFEMKGKATDKIKKPEVLKHEQQEKLKQLELNCKARMVGPTDACEKSSVSADSLLYPKYLKCAVNKESVQVDMVDSDDNNDSLYNKTTEEEAELNVPQTQNELTEMVLRYNDNLSSTLAEIMSNLKQQNNYRRFEEFFEVLLKYACVVADKKNLSELDNLVPYLYELSELSPNRTSEHLFSVLTSAEQNFQDNCEKTGRARYPKFSTLILLKLCNVLYPPSDFRHKICTPAMVFLMHLLSECSLKLVQGVLRGLFTCSIALEYVSYSKRYLPEAMNLLLKILYIVSPKGKSDVPNIFKPLRLDLCVTNVVTEDVPILKLSEIRKYSREVDDVLKVQIVKYTIELLVKFLTLYSHLPSVAEVFSSIATLCENLPTQNYPDSIKQEIEKLLKLPETFQPKNHLKQPKQGVKMLRFLEPRIEDNFDGRKTHKGSKPHLDKKRLQHRYKREFKGAIRELRNDNRFLSNQKFNEQMERDAERKRKVKELYRDLAMQEGDFKALKKKKSF